MNPQPTASNGSPIVRRTLASPIGMLTLEADGTGLRAVRFEDDPGAAPEPVGGPGDHDVLDRTVDQLDRYFAGRLVRFDLPLAPTGTAFQREVWRALEAIPYGDTTSYAKIAAAVGRPRAFRAVGLANGRNPIPVIIPCHRVIGADGSLTGYGGGIHRKVLLLDLEARVRGTALNAAGA
jgi:methylated-DNA-[protein]-cysteine S-methyltransferase